MGASNRTLLLVGSAKARCKQTGRLGTYQSGAKTIQVPILLPLSFYTFYIHTMSLEPYKDVEDRIINAIAFQRYNNDQNLAQIARDFEVLYIRLRYYVLGVPSKTTFAATYLKRLRPNQEEVLYQFIVSLDCLGLLPRFALLKQARY